VKRYEPLLVENEVILYIKSRHKKYFARPSWFKISSLGGGNLSDSNFLFISR